MVLREEENRSITYSTRAIALAQCVLENESHYPPELAFLAARVVWDSSSHEEQEAFLAAYNQAPLIRRAHNIPDGLDWSPTEMEYYKPHELNLPGIEIGIESLHGYAIKLFPGQLRRHCLVLGMTGSGKSNLLLLIAIGIAALETKGKNP